MDDGAARPAEDVEADVDTALIDLTGLGLGAVLTAPDSALAQAIRRVAEEGQWGASIGGFQSAVD